MVDSDKRHSLDQPTHLVMRSSKPWVIHLRPIAEKDQAEQGQSLFLKASAVYGTTSAGRLIAHHLQSGLVCRLCFLLPSSKINEQPKALLIYCSQHLEY